MHVAQCLVSLYKDKVIGIITYKAIDFVRKTVYNVIRK